VTVKTAGIWSVMLCRLLEVNCCFGRTFCL